MNIIHRVFVTALPVLALALTAVGQEAPIKAPNLVVISPLLTTSGQPSAAALAALGSMGYAGVIYLAPLTVPDAVPGEADLLQRQGVAFANIPIRFDNPTEQDFEAFAAALTSLQGKRVLVHCQVNMRASSMTFLHRVIVGKESPEVAYESVVKVWSPDGPWKRFMVAMLRKHGHAFEPY